MAVRLLPNIVKSALIFKAEGVIATPEPGTWEWASRTVRQLSSSVAQVGPGATPTVGIGRVMLGLFVNSAILFYPY